MKYFGRIKNAKRKHPTLGFLVSWLSTPLLLYIKVYKFTFTYCLTVSYFYFLKQIILFTFCASLAVTDMFI